ncbi:hypothetical protein [Dapis sp. BLCC M229]
MQEVLSNEISIWRAKALLRGLIITIQPDMRYKHSPAPRNVTSMLTFR